MKKIILLMFILSSVSLFSQEKLNQFDSNGKKNGKWIVWLDKDWKLAKDSLSASSFRYNYFINGRSMYPMGPMGGKSEAHPNSNVKKGNAVLLDGEYKWFHKNGKVRFVNVLKDGWYVSYKEYRADGTLETVFDYTEHDREQKYSWAMYSYNKKGELISKSFAYEEYGGKGVDN
jgi:hypothetical protein